LMMVVFELMVVIPYRKSKDSNIWHMYADCPSWPTRNYDEAVTGNMPEGGGLCLDCFEKWNQRRDESISLSLH
jgi:hypothetical protein